MPGSSSRCISLISINLKPLKPACPLPRKNGTFLGFRGDPKMGTILKRSILTSVGSWVKLEITQIVVEFHPRWTWLFPRSFHKTRGLGVHQPFVSTKLSCGICLWVPRSKKTLLNGEAWNLLRDGKSYPMTDPWDWYIYRSMNGWFLWWISRWIYHTCMAWVLNRHYTKNPKVLNDFFHSLASFLRVVSLTSQAIYIYVVSGFTTGISPKQFLLAGGFNYVLCSSLFGEDSHFGKYCSTGLKPPTSLGSHMTDVSFPWLWLDKLNNGCLM